MNTSDEKGSDASVSPPSSSPLPSPRTDTMQYAAFHDTQGDWHDMTCSPSNCVINTISPHTPFSPPRSFSPPGERPEPPTIRYIPQFDYKFSPNKSPLNYPNPNMTFFNPYTSKSCKRTLNTSGSSVGSRQSPCIKRIRQNISRCLGSTDLSKSGNFSNDDTLDKTCVAANDASEAESKERDESDLSDANLLCENCPDLLRIVGVCTTCPDKPHLCQLCVDAHKRVRLTREHVIHILAEQDTTCARSVPQILESIIELLEVDLDDSITSATDELSKTWNINLGEFSDTAIALDMKHSEEVIEAKFIPVFSRGPTSVKLKAVGIIQKLIELRVVNVSSAFANDKCIKGFEELINSEDSEVIVVALDCIQCLVKEIAAIGAKFSLIKLHSQLEKQLRRLKLYEMGYSTAVQFKAAKLMREMEKCLME